MNRTIVLVAAGLLAAAGPLMAQEATPPAETMTAPAAAESAPTSQGEVARAIITSGISDREPIDELSQVGSDVPVVYLFTELRGMQGERVTHRWEHDGQVVAEVGFDVKGERWRVWSSKKLPAGLTGTWKVNVVNSAGEVLATREFTCGAQE